MPEDTKYIINESQLTAIGNSIRTKLNEQTTYTVDEMPEKINEIGGGSEPQKVVIISEQTVQGEPKKPGSPFYLVDVSLENELIGYPDTLNVVLDGVEYTANKAEGDESYAVYLIGESDENYLAYLFFSGEDISHCGLTFPDGDQHTIEAYTFETEEPTEIVYIPEQTVTLVDNQDSTYRAELSGVNIDLSDPPATIPVTITKNGESYTTDYILSGRSTPVTYRDSASNADITYENGKWWTIQRSTGEITITISSVKTVEKPEVRTCEITMINQGDESITVSDYFSEQGIPPLVLNNGMVDFTLLGTEIPSFSVKQFRIIYLAAGQPSGPTVICSFDSGMVTPSKVLSKENCELSNGLLAAINPAKDSSIVLGLGGVK